MTSTTMTPQKNISTWDESQFTVWERYNVVDRMDDELVYENTFVLLPDSDPHAKVALFAYARSIQNEHPEIANQIWDMYDEGRHNT